VSERFRGEQFDEPDDVVAGSPDVEVRGAVEAMGVKHFHEHLQLKHGRPWSYSWVKTKLQAADLVPRLRRRGSPHRHKHERCESMMLHQDSSRAVWLAGRSSLDLVVTTDDDTSTLYSALPVEQEGTARRSAGCSRCSRPRACRSASTPITAAITS
jgi:hypothetical protein